MSNHLSHSAAILLTVLFTLGSVQAVPDTDLTTTSTQEEKPKPLSRALATHLIAEFYELGKTEVKIAYILEGKLQKDGFETSIGAEVTFLRPVVDEGRRRRAVHSIRFQHDKELGWFLRAIVKEDGHTYIDICSETQGRIRLK